MGFVTSEPKKIYEEDVQFSASVSEAVANKLAATLNYCIDNFDRYEFGVSGNVYSGLSAYPYVFTGCLENIRVDSEIHSIEVYNEISGISGDTNFRLLRLPAGGGSPVQVFNACTIKNTAADNLSFDLMVGPPPTDVLYPLAVTTALSKDDKLIFVLISAADQAQNLRVKVTARPV